MFNFKELANKLIEASVNKQADLLLTRNNTK